MTINTPQVFRLNIEVGDMERAVAFYNTLFGIHGIRQPGSRLYYTCGSTTLQLLDTTGAGGPHPLPKALYFAVNDLETVFERAKELDCVSADDVHGVSGGGIITRDSGERSFYAYDPWGNPLCFVDSNTIYVG